jgi:hypothetical protein
MFMPCGAKTPDEKKGLALHVQKWATNPFAQMEMDASPSGHTVDRRRPLERSGDIISKDKKPYRATKAVDSRRSRVMA